MIDSLECGTRAGSRHPAPRWPAFVWALALGLALLGSGVGTASTGTASATGVMSARTVAAADTVSRQSCTTVVSRAPDVARVLGSARPGDTLCFTGTNLARTDLQLSRSGTARSPIRLLADGAPVHRIAIAANDVVLQGFNVIGGDELLLRGSRITAAHNTVRDTQRGGIICDPCLDSSLDSNLVQHAAQIGIFLAGQRTTVTGNQITGIVPRGNSDADGIRFFGDGHRIVGNTISDISAAGYADPPHPDCFQSFVNDAQHATFDVLIAKNLCRNVDAQCLIATSGDHGNGSVPAGVPSVRFVGNTCLVDGAQAVYLRNWPGAEVRDNSISGAHMYRGILAVEGSTGCQIVNNTTSAGIRPVEVDDSSRPGCVVSGNRAQATSRR